MDKNERFLLLSGQITNGETLDWDAVVEEFSDSQDRHLTRKLRALAEAKGGNLLDPQLESVGHGCETAPQATGHPAKWGHLNLLGTLGTGAFGDVYRALETHLDMEVALKLVPLEKTHEKSRFQEARRLAQVRHPNVLIVHGVDTRDGMVGMWMELIHGSTLAELIEKTGLLGAAEATTIGLDLCRAASAVHAKGLIHRDIKCENVMREVGGRIVLMDFGLAQEGPTVDTQALAPQGTPLYMAPELFLGSPQAIASDVYAVGVVLFHLLTGKYPVAPNSLAELLQAHTEGKRQRLLELRPDLPISFSHKVDQCLERDPKDRPATMADLAALLTSADKSNDYTPGLHPPDGVQNNIRNQSTPFIGRDLEVEEIEQLLEKKALVTLTGFGGSGKTRLALEVARRNLSRFPDGVWLVDLAPLTDPELVAKTVASAIGLVEDPDRSTLESLTDFLTSRSVLLVIDNCEHLIDACALVISDLLSRSPSLRILATSRESLRISAEHIYKVSPLQLPTDASIESLNSAESSRFLVLRLQTVLPGFSLDDSNAPHIEQICLRLEGIPLALELAAASAPGLDLATLAQRLEKRFRVLHRSQRDAVPRHRTLKTMVEWSWDGLSVPERTLLQRLSVFRGGWSLDAAERVCADDNLPADDVLDLLTTLIEKSLIEVRSRERSQPVLGYGMLETIREYSAQTLQSSEDIATTLTRHTDYYTEFAGRAGSELTAGNQAHWFAVLDSETANLRATLARSETKATDRLKLAAPLGRYWWVRGSWREGLNHCMSAIESASIEERRSRDAIRVLNWAGTLSLELGLHAPCRSLLSDALDRATSVNDRKGMAGALIRIGYARWAQADGLVESFFEKSLTTYREIGDQRGIAAASNNLGVLAYLDAKYTDAMALFEQSLTIARDLNDTCLLSAVLTNRALVPTAVKKVYVLHHLKDLDEVIQNAERVGDRPAKAAALSNKANFLGLISHEHEKSLELIAESLDVWRSLGASPRHEIQCLWNMSCVAKLLPNDPRFEQYRAQHQKASQSYRGTRRSLGEFGVHWHPRMAL